MIVLKFMKEPCNMSDIYKCVFSSCVFHFCLIRKGVHNNQKEVSKTIRLSLSSNLSCFNNVYINLLNMWIPPIMYILEICAIRLYMCFMILFIHVLD